MSDYKKYRKYKGKYLALKELIRQHGGDCTRPLSGLLTDSSCGLCHTEAVGEKKFHYADCDWTPTKPCNEEIKNLGYGLPETVKPNETQCQGRSGCEWRDRDCRKPCTRIEKMNKKNGC